MAHSLPRQRRSLRDVVRNRGTLDQLYSGRANAIGLLRLLMATAVIFSHSKPLSGAEDLGVALFRQQSNVGGLAVYGFFVLSGVLITRSARGTAIGRYIWHRALRILPALWVCLVVTAFLVAPLVYLHERGTLAGFLGPGGPVDYVRNNMWTGVRQYGIHDLLAASTPYGRHTGASVFNGSLWSLVYEMLCYIMIGILAVTGVLRSSRRFVLFLTVVTYLLIVRDHVEVVARLSGLGTGYPVINLPLIGIVQFQLLVYLTFLFLVGACFDLYRDKLPINDVLGVASALLFVGSLLLGGFFLIGFPAYAYLLIWLAIRLPKQTHWVGRKNDYSYGVYIYGFVGQQVFASLGWYRWGYFPYVAMSLAAAFAAAWLSWHLVEKHALSLKSWTPELLRRVVAALRAIGARRAKPQPAPAPSQREFVDRGSSETAASQPPAQVPARFATAPDGAGRAPGPWIDG